MADRYLLVWSRTALEDLESILEYVARSDGADRSLALYDALRTRVDSLVRFPRRGRIVPELKRLGLTDFRELIVSPYRVFFCIDGNTIVLLGVVDGRRDLEELLLERTLRAAGRGGS